MATQPDPVF